MSIFTKILSGLEWLPKEIGKGISALPKIIKLAEDASQVAKDSLPLVLAVVADAAELVAAVAKDSGVFLKALSSLAGAISTAVEAKALNITADEAVASAFMGFVRDFNRENVQDILTAIAKLGADVSKLDATVLAGIKKLEADAK